MTSYLSDTTIVPGASAQQAVQDIYAAQSALTQQTWGSGNVVAGLASLVPQVLLSQAALSLTTWEAAMPATQAFVANTVNIPIVHQVAEVSLLGAVLLPSMAGMAMNSTALLLPVVGAFGASTTEATQLVSAARRDGWVYGVVPVTMNATTEPVVYVSIDGGPSVPVLVDTGSSGLVISSSAINSDLGTATGSGSSAYSGGLSYTYTTYDAPVGFGNGMVTEPTSVNVVDTGSSAAFEDYFAPAGVVGVLGIGANTAGPGPSLVNQSLPGELSDGALLYQSLFFGSAGVLVFGPNPLPVRVSVPGAPDANVTVKVNNGDLQDAYAIIDSGGVYGTLPAYLVAGLNPGDYAEGTKISVYTADGSTLLYSYTTGSSVYAPLVVGDGDLMNTGYVPFQKGPVYLDYSPDTGIGSTNFDYV